MPTNRKTILCRYHYDPLDRLAACSLSAQVSTQRFYLKTRLATEIQGLVQRSIFQQEDQLLAQQQHQGGTVETTLLATDQQRSVLNALDATQPHPLVYTPYGHRASEGGLLSLLGFNGERPDPVTGHYLLGNGYRAFNPVLMRFNSPDSWSPFGEGGVNAYAYCVGDPVNREDRTGHASGFFARMMMLIKRGPRVGFKPLAGSRESLSSTVASSGSGIIPVVDSEVGVLIAGLDEPTNIARSITGTSTESSRTANILHLIEDAPQRIKDKLPRLNRATSELERLKNPKEYLADLKFTLEEDYVPSFQIQIAMEQAEKKIPRRIQHLQDKIERLTRKIQPFTSETNADISRIRKK